MQILVSRTGHGNGAYLPIDLGAKMLKYLDESFLTTILNPIHLPQLDRKALWSYLNVGYWLGKGVFPMGK